MITRQWKFFADYEKEEKWLNEKVAKGFAMMHYNFCHYTFEDCVPGEYIYRIELLKNRVTHPDSVKYIHFMEDSGAEQVASYLNWVYFRKKAADGPFEIFSDIESRIAHYQRIVGLWIAIGCLILFAVLMQIPAMIDLSVNNLPLSPFQVAVYVIFGPLLILDIVCFFKFFPRYIKKVKELKRERDIRE
ncbi:MAG: DUF2812 domain-containing protein [Firmicutes bacterium]|nr:DUF2812 domain-containing protein [Bacillota bacterium]